MGDHHIGLILATAPTDPDDGLPLPLPVRQLLENGQSADFEDGFVAGLHSRLTGSRGGLLRQRDNAPAVEESRRIMRDLNPRWRRTKRLIEQVVDALEHHERQIQAGQNRIV